jgi:error-prone DNA polymerase
MGRVRIDPTSRLPLDPVPEPHGIRVKRTVDASGAAGEGDAAGAGSRMDESGAEGEGSRADEAGFVELFARSNFSFLQGASPPEALVQRAAELGYDTLGIADRDGLYGMVRALEEADRCGLRLVVGCELTVGVEPRAHFGEGVGGGVGGGVGEGVGDGRAGIPGPPYTTVTVHVQDHDGYSNLCRILTESHKHARKGAPRRKDEKLARNIYAAVPLEVVCAHAQGLWMTIDERTLAWASSSSSSSSPADTDAIERLREAFGERLSVAAVRHLDGDDRASLRAVLTAHERYGIPIVATNRVRYATRAEKPILDVLHCIREGTTLDRAGRALSPNAEAHLKAPNEMARLFADHPEWRARARVIAEACRFSLRELKYKFPCELEDPHDVVDAQTGDVRKETPNEALRRLTYEGARARYGGIVPKQVEAQIERELSLIAQLDVAPYFLSVRTIVDIARRRDILCQGRGSAANSAVCFCLGVTAVDPARSNLLFERFLSAERHEPPDIDVDFEHERREEVIQEIYERYGRERAAMVSEVVCYRGKSALREVGKAFGFSLEQVERLATLVSYWDRLAELPDARIREVGFDPEDARVRQALGCARDIQGFPRHLSIHVGGFVLSATPLTEVAPVEPATMPGRTVIPWDKDDLDTLGFFKVDVLALGILTAIRKALDMVQDDARVTAGTAIDRLARIPSEDPCVYDALCKADTVGVFQIESRAQMAMLPRLKPRTFYDLVVEVAIVRPGPIQGGMVHPYLRRREGLEPADVPHPTLAHILERTLGVPLFQEQVMQIAIVGAGYTGGEADQLRRDMAAWRKNGKLERHRARLIDGFKQRGIAEEFGERLYAQITGFGEYGFPESHAASFALLVYASAWIKTHHPAAFAAALLNSQPMGFYSPSTILQDAQRHGVRVLPVRVEASDWDCTLEGSGGNGDNRGVAGRHDGSGDAGGGDADAKAIRVGLRQVKGLGEEAGRRIEAARKERPFHDVEDLAARAGLRKGELSVLAAAGALEALMPGRREAMWKVHAPRDEGLFAGKDLGDLTPMFPRLSRAEQLSLDYGRTGFSVSDHPMRILRPELPRMFVDAKGIERLPKGEKVTTAGLVICRQRPQTASGVVFITMEDEHGFINLIVWGKVFDRFRHVATTASMLVVRGTLERQGDVVYIIAERLERLAMKRGGVLPSMSRDFH